MDEVFYYCNLFGISEYSSFLEYCSSLGCVKEEGSIDVDLYKKKMNAYIQSIDNKVSEEEKINSLRLY